MYFTKTSQFKKSFARLSNKEKVKFNERMSIFIFDQYSPILNNHKLHGEYADYRSVNITSDIRLVYRNISKEHVLLHRIGTHSELYT